MWSSTLVMGFRACRCSAALRFLSSWRVLRSRQLAGRCGVIHIGAFPDAKEWRQLVAAMEGTLRLHRHEPGTLVA
jgi:hypothetical protein